MALALERMREPNGGFVLRLRGRIDAETFHFLDEAVLRLLGEGERAIALDLADVELITSAGATSLLMADMEAKRLGGRVALRRVPEAIFERLEMLGLREKISDIEVLGDED